MIPSLSEEDPSLFKQPTKIIANIKYITSKNQSKKKLKNE
jgi:hypothetical protein